MAKRDPNKTARNRIIKTYKEKLREILPKALAETGLGDESSLNATIGSKNDEFFDLKNEVIHSQDEFVSRWLEGLKKAAEHDGGSVAWLWKNLKKHKSFRKYVLLFLKRSYLNHFDELSKNRPLVDAAEIWIGQQNASYGLLVTPRFRLGQWENDKSEIRAFRHGYWTIGHIMETGFVIPGKNKVFEFSDIEQYLLFFQDTLVRNSGVRLTNMKSRRLLRLRQSEKMHPELVPLLIPEFRYAGLQRNMNCPAHFLVVNPYTLNEIGFKLSPW